MREAAGIDYGPEADFDFKEYAARWFDHFLKGVDNGVEGDPPVYVFVMGENAWHAEEDWPLPQTRWTRYYLSSGGHANSLKGDGILGTSLPAAEGHDSYVYDPLSPTRDPFFGRPGYNGHIDGAVDARLPALGDEVLVYETPPLEEAVEVTGPIEARLYASTSARDTDWMVRLVDVGPDGYAALLADGVMRARNRDQEDEGRFNAAEFSTIEPGEVYEYTIRFWRGTGNLFRVGHRIRIEISSSYYPNYLPNLNTGHDNVGLARAEEAVVAEQRVYHGGEYASHVVLPVIVRGR
jgi:putative CocE/NonD family hydrolase